MRCLLCSKKIGLLRRLVDRQFCCDGHRKRGRQAYSARAARDIHYEESFEDGWLPKVGTPAPSKSSAFGPGSGVLLVVLSTLMVMFLPTSPNGTGNSGVESYLPPVSGLTDRLSRAFPSSRSAISLREDFRMDLRNWQTTMPGIASGWSKVGNAIRVGEMRLWKPTLTLADYNIEFAGQIESRAMSWAFRAKDPRNFYATKIAIGGNRAEIIRYTMLNGTPTNRVSLPIPLGASGNNMTYEVKMRVRGDRFTTMVNGQAVDSWTDRRLRRGGVGFFNEPGERALLHWVSISERESFLQRFLSFSFLVHPTAWPLEGADGGFEEE